MLPPRLSRSMLLPVRLTLLVLLACALPQGAWGQTQPPQAAPPCDSVFAQAEAAFYDGAFEETVRLLAPCAAPDALEAPTAAMYRLLSMAFMNAGDAAGARRAITNLLLQRPAYQPDPIQDPPAYVVLVSVVREQLRAQALLPDPERVLVERPRRGRLLSFVGATVGLVAVGVAAYLVGEPRF